MEADLSNFISPEAFKIIVEDQLGWLIKEYKIINGLAIVRPDFYPTDYILATSKKAIIICKGWSEFEIEGNSFTSIDMAIEKLGTRILDDFPNWVWKSEKEWVVLKGNGDWATSFTLLNECPFRTKVRC